MLDDQPTAEAEEVLTGAPGTTEEATADSGAPAAQQEPTHDWEQRYNELRADHNRRLNLWNRAQQGDIEAMRELNLPVDFGDEEGPDQDYEEDEPAIRDPRLDALLQEREQERLQRQQEEGWNRFNSDLDKVAKGSNLSDDDRLMLYTKTLQAGGSPDALSEVYSEFKKSREAYDKAVIAAYVESKKNAPFVNPGGTGANEVTDPLDGHARRERLAARMAAQELG